MRAQDNADRFLEEIEKELLSSEEEVEEVRRAQMSSWGGKSLIWGSVIIFLTLLVSYLTDFFPYGLFIGAVLLVFVISGLYSSCKSEVSAVYKEKIIGKLTRMMLKLPGIPKPDDTADALAMAITHAQCSGSRQFDVSSLLQRAQGPVSGGMTRLQQIEKTLTAKKKK